MGIPSERRFPAAARRRLAQLFPRPPGQSGYLTRRRGLRETIDWPAGSSPGEARATTTTWCCSTLPVECGRSLETVRRPRLGECAGDGWSRSNSRVLWGMRLHLVCAREGTPRRAELRGADQKEREVALELLPRTLRGGEIVVCDNGYVGRGFERSVAALGGQWFGPAAWTSLPAPVRTWGASASASSRSSRP